MKKQPLVCQKVIFINLDGTETVAHLDRGERMGSDGRGDPLFEVYRKDDAIVIKQNRPGLSLDAQTRRWLGRLYLEERCK